MTTAVTIFLMAMSFVTMVAAGAASGRDSKTKAPPEQHEIPAVMRRSTCLTAISIACALFATVLVVVMFVWR